MPRFRKNKHRKYFKIILIVIAIFLCFFIPKMKQKIVTNTVEYQTGE